MSSRRWAPGSQRGALTNIFLVRHVITHLLAVVAEWGMFVGVLVYSFDQGGARWTGIASLAMILPYLLASPLTGALAQRYRPQRMRAGGLVVQVVGGTCAALAASAEMDAVVVIAAAAFAAAGITTLRPSGATLAPALVRSSGELTVANLWTGYCEVASALLGPLVATTFIAAGGSTLAIAGCCALAALAVVITVVPPRADPPGGLVGAVHLSVVRLLSHNLSEIRQRPGLLTVVVAAGAQLFAVGAFDIILVVAAEGRFEMGESGAGVLMSVFGLGAVVSAAAVTVLVRRPRLASVLTAGMLLVALAAALLGAWLVLTAAFVLLPLIGGARAAVNSVSDVLLHRSAAPELLSSVYAVREVATGAGLILGSLSAQLLIAVSGVRAAIFAIAVVFAVLALATRPAIKSADANADVPVVSMSLLRQLPIFAELPRPALETVSRSAREVHTRSGDVIIHQGADGDEFYAIAEGVFEVSIDGDRVATLGRGDGFGELALLADRPRAATVTATTPGLVVALERTDFLIAVTGHDASRQAAWGVVNSFHPSDIDLVGPGSFAALRDPDELGSR